MEEAEKVGWFNDVLEGRHKGHIYVASRNPKTQEWRFQVLVDNRCFFLDLSPAYVSDRIANFSNLKVGDKVR